MVEIVSTSIVSRVTVVRRTTTGPTVPIAPQSTSVPPVVAVLGVPGQRGEAGKDGTDFASDPGDLTLIFDNQLV